MKQIENVNELKVGQVVYYIPRHLDPLPENAQRGTVSTIRDNHVWVRYTDGDTGARTPKELLYV